MNSKITVSFECENADLVSYLMLVYEALELSFNEDYEPSYNMKRLPDFLAFLNDALSEHISDGGEWCKYLDGAGHLFRFSDEEYAKIKRLLGWPEQPPRPNP